MEELFEKPKEEGEEASHEKREMTDRSKDRPKSGAQRKGKMSFEQCYEKLQKVIEDIEAEDIALDELVKKFEEGVKLLRMCNDFLKEAKLKLEQYIEERDGKFIIKGLSLEEEEQG